VSCSRRSPCATSDRLAVLAPTPPVSRSPGLPESAADDGVRRAVAEVAELRSRLDNAADDYADGTVDREQFHRITEQLRPRLEAAQARTRVVDSTPPLAGLGGAEDVAAVWEGLPLSRRRRVVDLLLEVRVLRTKPGTRTFDPEAVAIHWRVTEGVRAASSGPTRLRPWAAMALPRRTFLSFRAYSS